MSNGSTPNGFEAIRLRLAEAESFLALTHSRPDGDAVGCLAALASAAGGAGKTCKIILPDGCPDKYKSLLDGLDIASADSFSNLADLASQVDLVVIVDTCSFGQLDRLADAIKLIPDKVVVIDHHASCDDVGSDRWVDTSAAATGVMILELTEVLGWPVEADAAEALVVAIAADTGWLRFANTDGRALRAMAKLVDTGVRPDVLYRRLFQSDKPSRLGLIQRMLASMQLHLDGQLAVMVLTKSDFADAAADYDQTENLVNEPFRIGSVEASVLLVEMPDQIRVSLRSREFVNVAALAGEFGGGGHVRAAGLRSKLPIPELTEQIVGAFAKVLDA